MGIDLAGTRTHPIDMAYSKASKVQQELELTGAELHLANTALQRHLPAGIRQGDVGRALAQNATIEGKVEEAAEELQVVTELLHEEVAERQRLERKLAAERERPPG